jgi:hypothetical protein
VVGVDGNGVLVIDGQKVFPLGLSSPPPLGGKTPEGADALGEIAAGGANFLRIGFQEWSPAGLGPQLAEVQGRLEAAQTHGLRCWLWLGEQATLPSQAGSENEQIVRRIVEQVRGHPALGAYKGIDEPHNPFRPQPVAPQGMVRAYRLVKQLDPGHPLAVIHEPLSAADALTPYTAACDATGADIYPVSYPPGVHATTANKDISLVGDLTDRMIEVAAGKPVWMTLQIAWSGVTPSKTQPGTVPRLPTLLDERFMAYQAIVRGARGLSFFGGHLTQVMRPRDAVTGWNWTFWQLVLRPLLGELTSTAVGPALVAADAPDRITASAGDVQLRARRDSRFLYLIAVRRGSATSRVTFSGLPARHDGTPLAGGQVLFEYAQDPLPPPLLPADQKFRAVTVSRGSFRDWFGPHDVHHYRFTL